MTVPYQDLNLHEALRQYLTRCREVRHGYEDMDLYPRLILLGEICNRSRTTLVSWQEGRSENPPIKVLSRIATLACICPAVPPGESCDLELRARLFDAMQWHKLYTEQFRAKVAEFKELNPPTSACPRQRFKREAYGNGPWPAILEGIKRRRSKKERARNLPDSFELAS